MVKQKLYAYVDETGQDTQGQFFLVSVVITEQDRDKIVRDYLERDNYAQNFYKQAEHKEIIKEI